VRVPGSARKKVVLEMILEFFKKKNPAWTRIESFIIGKDFTELVVLKNLFASAMVQS
jgi:hypothetical protein